MIKSPYISIVLCAGILCSCAPITESPPQINIYTQLHIGTLGYGDQPALKILSIQKSGNPQSTFVPSPGSSVLWLRDGDYQAKLVCLRHSDEKYDAYDLQHGAPLDLDGYFHFSINADADLVDGNDPSYYRLDCIVTPDGKTLFVKHTLIEVIGN